MKQALRIAYLTIEDPRDRRPWSGTYHFLLRELEKQVEHVEVLGPLPEPFVVKVCKVFNQLTLRLLGKRFNYRASPWVAKAYARLIEKRLGDRSFDLIVAPAHVSTVAFLRTATPIVYINDRCMAGALGYHAILTDLFDWSRDQSLELERTTLRRATISVFSNHWAGDAALRTAPDVADRIHVVPFGANLPQAPERMGTGTWPNGQLKLLFLGVNWQEKGGPIAYEALLQLKRSGMPVRLVVCGCDPPEPCTDPDLVREGFLDKNDPQQLARLNEHLRTADLLILPTRFDASPVVLCEAASYGLPVLATRTGGIPTVVEESVTGLLFDPSDNGDAYARAITSLLHDQQRYQAMRMASRARFEQVLNWSVFVRTMLDHARGSSASKSSR